MTAPTIIGRAAWGARYVDGFGPAPLPAREVWLHHSATVAPDLAPPFTDDDAAVRALEQIGQDRFGGGISYTFAVTPTGRIYQGHSVGRRGAHTKGRNSVARAIVLVGNYDERHPTRPQIDAVAQLLTHGHQQGWWVAPRLSGGHRDAPGAATACPGRHAHAAITAINQLAAGAATSLEEADVPLTPQDAALIAEAVWTRATRNSWGDVVRADQILCGTERRVADVQTGLADLTRAVQQLRAAGVDPKAIEQAVSGALGRGLTVTSTVTPAP